MRLARTAALALLCGSACTQAPPGRRLASGLARGLIARDGAVAFLLDAGKPLEEAVPDDLLAGELWLDDRKVGSGVSTQEGAYAFSPARSELAWLARWRFREGEGELWAAERGGDPRQVAKVARAFAWSSRGELAWVGSDQVGFGERKVTLRGVQAVAWSPDGRRVAARASAQAGGRLWVLDAVSAQAREIALATSDFAFAPDGALAALGPPPPKGGDRPLLVDGVRLATATAFAFSPDGREIALFSTGKQPGESTGDLLRMPRSGGAPLHVASRVSDFRWGSGGDLLCISRYDPRARAGTLTVVTAGAGPAREIAQRVQSFTVFGRRILYVVQAPQKGDFRLELWGLDLAQASSAPRKIDEGVYGWALSPDGATLYYKARCAGGPRSCSLLRTALAGGEAELLSPNVAGFDLSRDGGRILLQQPHRGATRAVDLAVIAAQGRRPEGIKPFVEEVDPSSRFADDGGKRVVYAVIAASRGGVFLADAP
jgi:dipeptidyl aminopeptidase/acylaminoacyl peptidase